MIFLDSDIFVRDLRYPRDTLQPYNSRLLELVKTKKQRACTSIFNLLEVCGILSYNLNPNNLRDLYGDFTNHYGLKVLFPADAQGTLDYDITRIFLQIAKKQSLADAQIAYTVERFNKKIKTFVSWNAVHFKGKVSVPVKTPKELLEQF